MLSQYFERIEAQDKGAPIPISYDENQSPVAYIKVKRMFTPLYEKQIQELKALKYSAFSPQTDVDMTDLMTDWLCEYGITGWYGIKDPVTDLDIEFKPENVKRIFKSQAYIGLVNHIVTEASNRESFLEVTIAELENQLGKPLSEM